jgi:hypothetical protein
MEAWPMDNAPLQFDQARIDLLVEQCFDGIMLKVMPAAFYRTFTQVELYVFCAQNGLYGLPTTELLDTLNTLILEVSPHRHAIEIGAGNGAISRGLGIPGTDSHLQDTQAMQLYYKGLGLAPVKYGPGLFKLDGNTAVDKMRPEVVVGCWVTHKYSAFEHHRGGNTEGIDEDRILESVKRYIVVGNDVIHNQKPIMDKVTRVIRGDYLFSKSIVGVDHNAIYVWDQKS